jgi:hypothetical protein
MDYEETMTKGAVILRNIQTELRQVKEMAEELEDELPAGDDGIGDAKAIAEFCDTEIAQIDAIARSLEGEDEEDVFGDDEDVDEE